MVRRLCRRHICWRLGVWRNTACIRLRRRVLWRRMVWDPLYYILRVSNDLGLVGLYVFDQLALRFVWGWSGEVTKDDNLSA